MKRTIIDIPGRPTRRLRRGTARSGWNEWIDDDLDLRKLRTGRSRLVARSAPAGRTAPPAG